jgi:hypothetical protein
MEDSGSTTFDTICACLAGFADLHKKGDKAKVGSENITNPIESVYYAFSILATIYPQKFSGIDFNLSCLRPPISKELETMLSAMGNWGLIFEGDGENITIPSKMRQAIMEGLKKIYSSEEMDDLVKLSEEFNKLISEITESKKIT